jgi:hypothetical protein
VVEQLLVWKGKELVANSASTGVGTDDVHDDGDVHDRDVATEKSDQ